MNELATKRKRSEKKRDSNFSLGFIFVAFTDDLVLTFTGALTASPTHADDDTNQNNYSNKTSNENGNDD